MTPGDAAWIFLVAPDDAGSSAFAERRRNGEHGKLAVRVEHPSAGANDRRGLARVVRSVDDHDRRPCSRFAPVVSALRRPPVETLELGLREQLEPRVECDAAAG